MTERDLEGLLARDTPFLDVRSPGEHERGSVPGSCNLPLLTDDERRRVGIAYKARGAEAALALGHELVSGERRRERERQWLAFARTHPDAWIYCWRGGARSEIVQRWLRDLGAELPRVPGGFKALRHVCLGVLARAPRHGHWVVVGGRTGSGKTALIAPLPHAIDLEALACHRGSAFGAEETPQPPPVTFDAALACAVLRHRHDTIVVEDESRTIGRLALPEGWHARMQQAPVALLEVPLDARVVNIEREYVALPLSRGVDAARLHARYADAVRRIERRLGGQRAREVREALERGFATGAHGDWIERLLIWYYDPMYDHQLAGKRQRVVVQGGPAAVREYLQGLEGAQRRQA